MKKPLPGQTSFLLDAGVITPSRIGTIRDVHWSYSRRSTLEQCPRRYYFEYFGALKRTAKQEPMQPQLHFLREMQNRYQRAGSLLHLAISTFFRKAQQSDPWDGDRLVWFAQKIFQQDQLYSQREPDGQNRPAVRYPPVLLTEYHYRNPNAATLCAETATALLVAIRTFVSDPQFMAFRLAGSTPGALIEYPISIPDFPCVVSGRIDLAYEQDGQVTVVDWKLGAADGDGNDSLQLATYGLWAIAHFHCPVSALRICKVHLGSAEVVNFPVNDHLLALARLRIMQDAERMAALRAFGEEGVADAFTPCMQPAVCQFCPFQRMCYAGD